MSMKKLVKMTIIVFLSWFMLSCAKNKSENESVFGKKRIEPNIDERMKQARDKGGGIFNSSRSNKNTTFEFSSSNVLWRASLNSLKSIPLSNVDYSGGVILTDWYSANPNSSESIKIKIQFNSNELSVSSVDVISHKKVCKSSECTITLLNDEFNSKIKNTIIEKAKKLEIEKENEKTKN